MMHISRGMGFPKKIKNAIIWTITGSQSCNEDFKIIFFYLNFNSLKLSL